MVTIRLDKVKEYVEHEDHLCLRLTGDMDLLGNANVHIKVDVAIEIFNLPPDVQMVLAKFKPI